MVGFDEWLSWRAYARRETLRTGEGCWDKSRKILVFVDRYSPIDKEGCSNLYDKSRVLMIQQQASSDHCTSLTDNTDRYSIGCMYCCSG